MFTAYYLQDLEGLLPVYRVTTIGRGQPQAPTSTTCSRLQIPSGQIQCQGDILLKRYFLEYDFYHQSHKSAFFKEEIGWDKSHSHAWQ